MKNQCLAKNYIYLSLLFIMITFNSLLLYQNYHLKKGKSVEAQHNLFKKAIMPSFVLSNLDGEYIKSSDVIKNSKFTLFIFFSLYDCVACLSERSLWQQIYEEMHINVIGVARHANIEELKGWTKNSGLTFPILYDKDSIITAELEIFETPLKLLVNNQGKIILADLARITEKDQKAFLKQIEAILN